MASPQVSNGFTRIANELLEAMIKFQINGTQAAIILAVIRETYGYNRKQVELGTSRLAEITGRNRVQVARELKKLVDMGLISEVEKAGFDKPRILAIGKNYESWKRVEVSTIPLTGSDSATGSETVELPVNESATEGVANPLHPTILKTNSKTSKDRIRFQKPKLAEMEAYAIEISLPVSEAAACMDYYIGNGWKVGKNQMVDWKAAVRNWKRNHEKFNGGTNGKPTTKPPARDFCPGEEDDAKLRAIIAGVRSKG